MRSPIQNNFKWVLPSASEGLALPESKVKKKKVNSTALLEKRA